MTDIYSDYDRAEWDDADYYEDDYNGYYAENAFYGENQGTVRL